MNSEYKVEVLVAAMNQLDHSLLEKMHIETDVIVGNQCDYDSVERFEWKGNKAVYLNFNEKGVGLNRNNALMRATGDICFFADEDMIYERGYASKIKKAFEKYSDADVIMFNIYEYPVKRYVIRYPEKVWWHNFLRYGAVRIAFKRESVVNKGIYFNQNFGGGCKHQHGEDNLFLADCLAEGLKLYAVPIYLARLIPETSSTWRKGYDEKYYADQGILYRTIFRRCWKIVCLQDAIRHQKMYGRGWIESYWLMTKRAGIKN